MRAALALIAVAGCTRCDDRPVETGDTAPEDDRVWVQLNAHPCALSEDGDVQCWRSAEWDPIIEHGTMIAWDGSADEPLSTISDDPGHNFWGLSRETGLPVVMYTPSGLVPKPMEGYTHLGGKCALLRGRFDCVDSYDNADYADLELVMLAGYGFLHVGLTPDNRLVGLPAPALDPNGVEDISIEGTVTEVMAFRGSTRCVLLETGVVDCYGPAPVEFPNPPYYDIAGGGNHGCAARDPGILDCSNGESYDFGEPLRDMTVTDWLSYEPFDPSDPDTTWYSVYPDLDTPPHICVITASNAIRCQGWRYDFPDLQRALPKGDGG